jgi:hypothetical protein
MPQRDQVFVSYSHVDLEHLKRLKVHLRPFEREELISVWSDTNIKASQPWREEIQSALQRAAVAILLISADFLASDFIQNEELPPLLDSAQQDGVKILSFILKPCAFTSFTSLSKYQAVNDPEKSLISLNESQKEQLWANLALTTKEALDEFKARAIAAEAVEKANSLPKSIVKWDKVATLFWLGNDLMWIQDMIYRDAAPERVLEGISHAIQYVEELGFDKQSHPAQELKVAKTIIEQLVGISPSTEEKRSFLQGHYRGVQQYVQSVKWYIHALATNQQPDFKKLRAL